MNDYCIRKAALVATLLVNVFSIAARAQPCSTTLLSEDWESVASIPNADWKISCDASVCASVNTTDGNPGNCANVGGTLGGIGTTSFLYRDGIVPGYSNGLVIESDFWLTSSGCHFTDIFMGLHTGGVPAIGGAGDFLAFMWFNKGCPRTAVFVGIRTATGTENSGFLLNAYTPNAWNRGRLVIRPDQRVEMHIRIAGESEFVHLWTSTNTIDPTVAPLRAINIIGKEGGGPARIDNLEVRECGGGGPVCGDGNVDPGEECDDSNLSDGDGCSSSCVVEPGFSCSGEPSACVLTIPICGDGNLHPAEQCEDGNTNSDDSCDVNCLCEIRVPGLSIDTPLRDLPPRPTLLVGSNVSHGLLSVGDYESLIRSQFGLLTPANAGKWNTIQAEINSPRDYAHLDDIVAVAKSAIPPADIKGHVLAWHENVPAGFDGLRPDEQFDNILGFVRHTVARYNAMDDAEDDGPDPGIIKYWDVVNEAIEDGNYPQVRTFYQLFNSSDSGKHVLRQLFEAAASLSSRETILIYNDYNIITDTPKALAVKRLMSFFGESNVLRGRLGVGFQAHFYLHWDPTSSQFYVKGSRKINLNDLDQCLR